MDRTRRLVALVCVVASCLFVLVAIVVGRPLPAVLAGSALVAAGVVAAWRTRPRAGSGPG